MNEIERERYQNATKDMSAEDISELLENIDTDTLWDELRKREAEERRLLQQAKEILSCI